MKAHTGLLSWYMNAAWMYFYNAGRDMAFVHHNRFSEQSKLLSCLVTAVIRDLRMTLPYTLWNLEGLQG